VLPAPRRRRWGGQHSLADASGVSRATGRAVNEDVGARERGWAILSLQFEAVEEGEEARRRDRQQVAVEVPEDRAILGKPRRVGERVPLGTLDVDFQQCLLTLEAGILHKLVEALDTDWDG
jgi:hypothetical protein